MTKNLDDYLAAAKVAPGKRTAEQDALVEEAKSSGMTAVTNELESTRVRVKTYGS